MTMFEADLHDGVVFLCDEELAERRLHESENDQSDRHNSIAA
jgi:hypothetical protein